MPVHVIIVKLQLYCFPYDILRFLIAYFKVLDCNSSWEVILLDNTNQDDSNCSMRSKKFQLSKKSTIETTYAEIQLLLFNSRREL